MFLLPDLRPASVVLGLAALAAGPASAQETDVTQTPSPSNAGIQKSYTDQIGAGRGDIFTPDSSLYIIPRDPARGVVRGRQVFQRKFTGIQGHGPRTNDGVGDIATDVSHGAGLADSCAACHARPQGSAGFGGAVFTMPSSRDAPHLFGIGLQEMLADEITQELRAIQASAVAQAVANKTSVTLPLLAKKSLYYGTITADFNGTVDTSGVEGVDPDLRVRPFFAEGGMFSIREFVVGAFDDEMGLEAVDPDLAAAAAKESVTTPSGMVLDGHVDTIKGPAATSVLDDPDGDGVVNEIPLPIVDYMEFYLLNYFKPARRTPAQGDDELWEHGLMTFEQIGCAECHVPNLRIKNDRRVLDFETRLGGVEGAKSPLYADAAELFDVIDDGSGYPAMKPPKGGTFFVEGIFTDFKRHDLGYAFWERRFDNTLQKEFMTEPLWGVGSTGPYGHDGCSITLEDVILRHGGEAKASRDAFDSLEPREKRKLIEFLRMLVLFSPPHTQSDTNPADTAAIRFPLNGNGSIDLSFYFNDPFDKE